MGWRSGRSLAWLWLAVLTAGVVAMAPASTGSDGSRPYQRIHLHADTGEYLWWSFAPHEESADRQLVTRTCPSQGGVPDGAPCLAGRSGTDRSFTLWFHPRSRVAEPVAWNAEAPLRFRLALDVDTPVPDFDVHLVHSPRAGGVNSSAPATEVEPGVWEGELDIPGALSEQGYELFGVQLRFAGEGHATVRLGVDGTSWIELPQPVAGWSTTDLWRQSPLSEAPRTFSTPVRSLWFSDDDWEVVTMEGTLAEAATLTHTTDRPAAAVIGWVEAFGQPVVYTAARDGELHAERITEAPHLRLLHGGAEVDSGTNPGSIAGGRGTDVVAATDLPAGELGLEVAPTEAGQTSSYTAYLLVVYGQRTLERIQVAFTPGHSVRQPAMRAVVVANCPAVSELIPLTSAATAVRARLDWDSPNPTTDWVPRFTLENADYPCSEAGTGPETTLALPVPQVFALGATPAYDATFVSYRDTIILADIRILYVPEG
ncbi:MAG: hypothetical protein KY469_14840 [Actinobacteria bacterium]|nr:hypothetical protein [Actinomycetota bacterium]